MLIVFQIHFALTGVKAFDVSTMLMNTVRTAQAICRLGEFNVFIFKAAFIECRGSM